MASNEADRGQPCLSANRHSVKRQCEYGPVASHGFPLRIRKCTGRNAMVRSPELHSMCGCQFLSNFVLKGTSAEWRCFYRWIVPILKCVQLLNSVTSWATNRGVERCFTQVVKIRQNLVNRACLIKNNGDGLSDECPIKSPLWITPIILWRQEAPTQMPCCLSIL